MAWAAALPPSAVSKTTLLPSSCSMEAARETSGVHGGGSSDTHPHGRPDCHDRRRSWGLLQRRRHIAWHYLGRSPAFAVCPMCAPSVRLRRIRCCHMHMSHAMLALGPIEAMPTQRDEQLGPNWAQRVQCAITWRSHPAAPVIDRTLRSGRHNEAADLGVKGTQIQISPARQHDGGLSRRIRPAFIRPPGHPRQSSAVLPSRGVCR
jgi:hypothetical protein